MHLSSHCLGCFSGLSCGVRLDIVSLLQKKKKMNVSEIAKHFKVTQPTISHHLIYLKEMGILKSHRNGRQILYYIDPKCGFDNCDIFK
jgi:DNA-binding transcriptional ArsR family regulator